MILMNGISTYFLSKNNVLEGMIGSVQDQKHIVKRNKFIEHYLITTLIHLQ